MLSRSLWGLKRLFDLAEIKINKQNMSFFQTRLYWKWCNSISWKLHQTFWRKVWTPSGCWCCVWCRLCCRTSIVLHGWSSPCKSCLTLGMCQVQIVWCVSSRYSTDLACLVGLHQSQGTCRIMGCSDILVIRVIHSCASQQVPAQVRSEQNKNEFESILRLW